MEKIFTALGLMSGTSMDGVDTSIIKSDGLGQFNNVSDKYWEFDLELRKKLVDLRNEIKTKDNLIEFSNELKILERELTIFHGEIVNEISSNNNENIDLIGFHGQTIFHDPKNKISKQLGDGRLLSQLTKKEVVYNFRNNDLQNGGQGAPLTPIFHNLLANNIFNDFKDSFSNILNIGGISNITKTVMNKDLTTKKIEAFDIGPGNCLIDEWIRKNTKNKFDNNGEIAKKGKTDDLILNQALDNFENRKYQGSSSFDTKDFSLSFVRGLSIEDGAATLTDFTGRVIEQGLLSNLIKIKNKMFKVLICGGGRKNLTLIESIKKRVQKNLIIQPIDDYGIDGDYVESQAFAFIAIRSFLGLPISFPETTGCKEPCTGGVFIKNY